jgi:hypothetical protein
MPETVLFSLLSACPVNQNRSLSKAILGPIYKTFTLNKMGMELTQSSIIKHPVVHHTACIGNIIEQAAFVPESTLCLKSQLPDLKIQSHYIPESTSYHISAQSNQGPSKGTKN